VVRGACCSVAFIPIPGWCSLCPVKIRGWISFVKGVDQNFIFHWATYSTELLLPTFSFSPYFSIYTLDGERSRKWAGSLSPKVRGKLHPILIPGLGRDRNHCCWSLCKTPALLSAIHTSSFGVSGIAT